MQYIDAYTESTYHAVQQWGEQCPTGDHAFAMVDMLFWYETAHKGRRPLPYNPGRSLLADMGGHDPAASTWLIALSDDAETRQMELQSLLDQTQGQPMLSLIASPLALDDLADFLAPLFQLTVKPDGDHYLARLGDNRTLPRLLACLPVEDQQALLAPIRSYLRFDYAGQAQLIEGAGKADAKVLEGLVLTQAQLNQWVDASQPDVVWAELRHNTPANWQQQAPSVQHKAIQLWLKQASDQGLHDDGQIQWHCRLGCENQFGEPELSETQD